MSSLAYSTTTVNIAQLVERWIVAPEAEGSSPSFRQNPNTTIGSPKTKRSPLGAIIIMN